MYAPARARWLREQRPQVHARIAHLLTIAGWLAYRLTGELADEPSLAGEAGLLDVNWRKHCLALLEKLGVSRGWLPPLVRAGTPIGTLHPSLAQIWGLEEGIPVTLAGPDTQCGLLSMQGVEEGEVGILAGWSCAVQMVTSRPCLDKERRTWVGCSPIEGLWVAESNLGDAGRAYRWLVETVADSHRPFEEVERLAQGTSPGAEGSLAFLGPGPVSMAKAGLRTGGLLFTTPISFQEVSKGQLFRAALENLAYSVKANLRILEEVTGLAPTGIHLGGGMSRSQTFARVLADVLGREVWVSPFPQVSAHGAAMAAAVSAGFYPDLKAASQAMALEQRKVEPQPVNVVEYQEHYQRWLAVYQRLQE
jgi:sugar (pentulose or hexulose) kinase